MPIFPEVSQGPLCDVKTWERTFGDRRSDDAFFEEQCIQYINSNRTCSLQIQKKGRGGCVDEVSVKLLDHAHGPNKTQAEVLASRDDNDAAISCKMTGLSGNLEPQEYKEMKFVTYSNSHGQGTFSHRQSRSSSTMVIVEHTYINKEADTGIYVTVEISCRKSHNGLDVHLRGPENRSLKANEELTTNFDTRLSLACEPGNSYASDLGFASNFDNNYARGSGYVHTYSSFRGSASKIVNTYAGRSGGLPRGRNTIIFFPLLCFSNSTADSRTQDQPGSRNNSRINSSGTAIGDGNGSIISVFLYHCRFGNFD